MESEENTFEPLAHGTRLKNSAMYLSRPKYCSPITIFVHEKSKHGKVKLEIDASEPQKLTSLTRQER